MQKLVAVLVCLAVGLGAATPLFDFETEAEAKAWKLRTPSDGLARSNMYASSGQYSLCFSTPAYKKGMEQWPAFEAGPPLRDWRGYDRLVIDIVNPSAEAPFLSFICSDSKVPFREGLRFSLPLPVRGFRRFVIPLSGFPKKVDRSDIAILHIFSQRPTQDMSVFVDNIVLLRKGEKPPEPEDALAGQLATMYLLTAPGRQAFLAKCSAQFISGTEAPQPAVTQAVRRELAKLGKIHDRLSAELRAPGLTLARFDGIREEFEEQPARIARKVAELVFASDFAKLGLPGDAMAVGFATSMKKILPKDMPFQATVARATSLSLARRETESFQVLVMPRGGKKLTGVQVSVGALKTAAGKAFPAAGVSCEVMGYVKTEKKPPYAVSYVGWWPDPILDFLGPVEIEPDVVQSFWIRVRTSKDQPAGTYQGQLTVSCAGQPPLAFGLTVQVRDFTLPAHTPLPTAVSFAARKRQMGGEEDWGTMKLRYADFLADYYIDYDSLYRKGAPDFEIIDHLHKQGRLVAFNLGNVFNAGIKGKDVAKAVAATVARIRPAYEKAKARGLLEYAYIYGFDERGKDQFPLLEQCAQALRKAFPEVLLMTTSYDHSFGLESCVKTIDAWCPLTPKFDMAKAEQVRAAGKSVWWYICCSPKNPYANWFVESDAIESRLLMGAMTAKYRPDGFLYYALSIWNRNKPIESGPFTDWNPVSWTTYHGDGSLFCSGPDGKPVPTIRLENYRDGMEDFAYACILEECIRRVQAKPKPTAAERRWLTTAQAALTVPTELVTTMGEYSHDPQPLLAWRQALGKLIEQSGIRDANPWGRGFAARGFRRPE